MAAAPQDDSRQADRGPRLTRILAPALLTLLLVVAFVALAGWNRTAEPAVRLTLTERELPRSGARSSGDDPGLQLRFAFESRSEPLDSRNWLTDDRLMDLGFPLDVLPTAPNAARLFNHALPRLGWVVFEYNGELARDLERRRAMDPTRPRLDHETRSRLVAVDAGGSFDALLKRYPADHLILRAAFRLGYVGPENKGPIVYAYISQLIPASVTVPRDLRPQIEHGERYEVDLGVGRWGIPFIIGARATVAER